MKNRLYSTMLLLFITVVSVAQVNYYASVDTNDAVHFPTVLHQLILNHNNVTTDYTDFKSYVNQYASSDAGNGQRKVTCVYSGEIKVYTPVSGSFSWGNTGYSVEHTWCQSWMPDATPAYGTSVDYHHLFPLNHNNANARRNNHPLGIVQTVTFEFLEGKLGYNEKGETVYEPRESHKGDAARALLYTSLCYNGKNTKEWTFNRLNTVILPGLSEGKMDLKTLLFWAQQDPPDDWERGKNDWVCGSPVNNFVVTAGKQNNRNPFVDHPEWMHLFNLNDLTYVAPGTFAPEPAIYPQGVTTIATRTTAGISWTEQTAQISTTTGYLIMVNTTGNFTLPTDGEVMSDDANLSDGSAVVNVAASDKNTYLFKQLPLLTTYYFRVIPYNIDGGHINYKTDSTIPNGSCTTGSNPIPNAVTAFLATVERFNTINLSWNNNSDDDDVVLVFSKANIFGAPVAGTNLQNGDSLNGGGKVIFRGKAGLFNHTNLVQSTNYYYRIWTISPDLNYSSAASATAKTFALTDQINLTPIRGELNGFGEWIDNEITQGGSVGTYYLSMLKNTSSMITPVLNFDFMTKQLNFLARTYGATSGNYMEITISASVDDGATWTVLGTRKPTNSTLAAVSPLNLPDTIYSGTSGRIKFETLSASGTKGAGLDNIKITGYESTATEIKDSDHIVTQLTLKNYPNPFNPSTKIDFTTTQSGAVDLSVYNIKGELVGTLVKGQFESGPHSAIFNAQALPSGIYICRLSTENHTQVQKMVLTK